MKSLSLSIALILSASVALACVRKAPGTVAVPTPPVTAVAEKESVKAPARKESAQRVGRRTLFERDRKSLDDNFFEMDIKKSLEKEIDPDSNLSTQFCVGGCAKKSVLQWSLEWQ